LSSHPYRTQASTNPPGAGGIARAWSHATTAPLIIASGPLALIALCAAARAYEGPWLMPTTILYSAIGYLAFLVGAGVIDSIRR
jgi:hypothetical protein